MIICHCGHSTDTIPSAGGKLTNVARRDHVEQDHTFRCTGPGSERARQHEDMGLGLIQRLNLRN